VPTRHLPLKLAGLLVLAALGVGAFAVAACGGTDEPLRAPGVAAEDQAALQHIHGLGLQDERLFVATHAGLFTAARDASRLQRVGDQVPDVMGFTVAGPERLLASGHPDLRTDLPVHLGLVESSDGGETWDPVSLLGEADFHVLEYAEGRLYGFDGVQGRFMSSDDGGRRWATLAAPGAMLDLAISPGDADRLVAATERGLHGSRDAGRSWRALGGGATGLLAWSADGTLTVLAADGTVLVSRDGGRVLRAVGSVGGAPSALTADGDVLYAALADGTVRRSADGGRTWTLRARP
jgi:photosystem II stability/assembly factor-like uncharacterized protein